MMKVPLRRTRTRIHSRDEKQNKVAGFWLEDRGGAGGLIAREEAWMLL